VNPDLLTDSPTVATLTARAELQRLRAMAGPPHASRFGAAALAEIDRLEDLIADAVCVADDPPGYVHEDIVHEKYVDRESYDDLDRYLDVANDEIGKLKARIDELEDAIDSDDPKDELVAALRTIDELKKQVLRTEKQRDALKSPAASKVLETIARLHPGRRSKAALQLYEKMRDAVEAVLKGGA
jgi:hypothetical protein